MAWSDYAEFDAWPFVVGALGIAFWLRIARILNPVIGRSRTVNLIADNTFSIMVNHFLGFMLVKGIFAFVFEHTINWFADFDWNAYHTNLWYYYLPKGLIQTRLIYIVVAIALAIAIQKGVDCFKKKVFHGDDRTVLIRKLIAFSLIIVMTVVPATLIARHIEASGGITVSAVNKYVLGTGLYFAKEKANVGKYITSGFSGYEPTFTWTDGTEATMTFRLVNWNRETDLKVSFTCGVYGGSQPAHIYFNDKLIGNLVVTGRNTHTLIVPKEFIGNNKNVVVKFKLPNASSPASHGESGDSRLLGLSMEYLEISANN